MSDAQDAKRYRLVREFLADRFVFDRTVETAEELDELLDAILDGSLKHEPVIEREPPPRVWPAPTMEPPRPLWGTTPT